MCGGGNSIACTRVTTSTLPSNARHEGLPRRLPAPPARSEAAPFPLKTGRLASPLAKTVHWTRSCFIGQRRNGGRYCPTHPDLRTALHVFERRKAVPNFREGWKRMHG